MKALPYTITAEQVYKDDAEAKARAQSMHSTIQGAYETLKRLKKEYQLVTLEFKGDAVQWFRGKAIKKPKFLAGCININAGQITSSRVAMANILRASRNWKSSSAGVAIMRDLF